MHLFISRMNHSALEYTKHYQVKSQQDQEGIMCEWRRLSAPPAAKAISLPSIDAMYKNIRDIQRVETRKDKNKKRPSSKMQSINHPQHESDIAL